MTSEYLLHRIRCQVFDYPEEKQEQVARVLQYLKKRKRRNENRKRYDVPVGRYSDLTKSELRKTGTCETDWF